MRPEALAVTAQSTAVAAKLPVNDAPYIKMLYRDPNSVRRKRSRIVPELGQLPFELAAPIRTFPAYRGKRAHEGRYWFSRSASHVPFESRFESTALMALDFGGDAVRVSSNPFWLLWPKGSVPKRHAPDFFVRCRDGSALVVDVKPEARITDQDRIQHARTRDVCNELGWSYQEFTKIDVAVDRNLRLLSGYHHQRFSPAPVVRAAITAQTERDRTRSLRLADLIGAVTDSTKASDDEVIWSVYHMLWRGDLRTDLGYPLTWNTVVRS